MEIFRPVLFLVWAAEGKTDLLFGAFIVGFLALMLIISSLALVELTGLFDNEDVLFLFLG